MKILVTGICGFAGTSISKSLLQSHSNLQIVGLDNFSRKGSELSISELTNLRIELIRGDIRSQSDIDYLPKVDWVIDCAANPSTLGALLGTYIGEEIPDEVRPLSPIGLAQAGDQIAEGGYVNLFSLHEIPSIAHTMYI